MRGPPQGCVPSVEQGHRQAAYPEICELPNGRSGRPYGGMRQGESCATTVARGTERGMRLTMPAIALAQVMHNPARLARLSRLIRQAGTDLVPLDGPDATAVGLLSGRTATADIVMPTSWCARRGPARRLLPVIHPIFDAAPPRCRATAGYIKGSSLVRRKVHGRGASRPA